jgi:hypothetical protein
MSTDPVVTKGPTYEALFQRILPQPHAQDLELHTKKHAQSAIEQALLTPASIDSIEQEMVLSQELANSKDLDYEGIKFIQEYTEAKVRVWARMAGLWESEVMTLMIVCSFLNHGTLCFFLSIYHRSL